MEHHFRSRRSEVFRQAPATLSYLISHSAGCIRADWQSLTHKGSKIAESVGGASFVHVFESFGAALSLHVAALRTDVLLRFLLVNSGAAFGDDKQEDAIYSTVICRSPVGTMSLPSRWLSVRNPLKSTSAAAQ